MGIRRRPHGGAKFVEAIGIFALGFAGLASNLVDNDLHARRVASWMAKEWSQCGDAGGYDAYGIF